MESIELNNYRCFEYLPLTFKSKVNLIIGDNASGKTTLMRALSAVLNSFFIGFSDENTRFFGLSKNDFTIFQTATGLANELPITIKFQNLKINAALELHSKKGRTLQKPLEPIFNFANKLYGAPFDEQKKQVHPLPLFASFSTNDIHSIRKIPAELFGKYDHKPSFGYYECLQGDGFLPYWTKRMLVLQEAHKGANEIGNVMNAVINALGPNGCNVIINMNIRHNQGKVYYIFSDHREVDTENLSDGYTRLVNFVVDIAFRCVILNGNIYGAESCKRTKGTVLIDEIDLHLHPTLRSVILKGLQNAFPNLQFIVTTHAPMVMTGIPMDSENLIYKLSYSESGGYKAINEELYGLDASTIIESVLGIAPRYEEVQEQLKSHFDLIDNENYERASEELVEMRKQFGDNLPDLAKAEAMLNFLNEGNDSNS